MKSHEEWMRLALDLARSTTGQTAPNPMVGAVVVNNGCLVGVGAHLQEGTPHAEVHALEMARENAQGGTLYVTLEPCDDHGQTPPCTEKIIASGVKQVVIGCLDPDTLTSGTGIERMRQMGIEIIAGVLEQECKQLNEAYFYYRQTGCPFITMKTATTLDGRIATASGDSRWVTNELSREKVHELRHQNQAILVGVGTVLADNPQLTTRLAIGGINPVRVIVDSKLRTPLDAAVTDVSKAHTWIFTTDQKDPNTEAALIEKGVEVISTGKGPLVDWNVVFRTLGEHGVLSVLAEGGSEVNASLLEGNWVRKVITFLSPKLLGGSLSLNSIRGKNVKRMADARMLHNVTVERYGDDICVIGYL